MAEVYEGDRPYIFVSYSRKNSEFVYPAIKAIEEAGYRVWYDRRIDWGTDSWLKSIADHVGSCAYFLAFVSPEFADSEWCYQEAVTALTLKKRMLVAYIEDFDLFQANSGLFFRLNQIQAKNRSDFDSDEAFIAELIGDPVLGPCLRDEVRARRDTLARARAVMASTVEDEVNLRDVLVTLNALPSQAVDDEVRSCVEQIERRLQRMEVEREKRRQKELRDKAIGVARVAISVSSENMSTLQDALDLLRELPDAVRDRDVDLYISQIEDRLRRLEAERVWREQTERERRVAVDAAKAALAESGEGEGALRDALSALRALPDVGGDQEVAQSIEALEERLRTLEDERERRERERRAYREAVDFAREALASHGEDEATLQSALNMLYALPESVRDQVVARFTDLLEDRLRWLEAERERREAEERVRRAAEEAHKVEVARRAAIEAAEAVLFESSNDEGALQSVLAALRALPGADGDRDVAQYASRIEARIHELEVERAERARMAEERRKEESAKKAAERAERDRFERERACREAEQARKAEEARRAAEQAERKRLEREKEHGTTRGASTSNGGGSPKPNAQMMAIGAVIVVAIVALVLGLARGGDNPTTSKKPGTPTTTQVQTTAEANSDDADATDDSGNDSDAASATTYESDKRLSSYSWDELKGIADEIAATGSDGEGIEIAKSYGLVDSDGRLQGDTKRVTLADGTEASVRIAGFRHDDLADGSGKVGITFEFADVPATHRMNAEGTNEGGWEASEMRGWLNGDFKELLPEELRSGIAAVTKRTNNKGGDVENDAGVVSGKSDELWLLSMSEVYGELSSQSDNVPKYPAVYDAEGTQYQLYADQGVSTTNYGFCKKDGANSWWWLRSPHAYRSVGFLRVYSDGDWNWYIADYEWGVSPGFCF